MTQIYSYLCVYKHRGITRRYVHRSRHATTPITAIMSNIMDDLGFPSDDVLIEQLYKI